MGNGKGITGIRDKVNYRKLDAWHKAFDLAVAVTRYPLPVEIGSDEK